MRLFVALELPEEPREQLEDLCSELPEARFTPFDQLHLTLAFLGEVDGGRARDVEEELATVRAAPLRLELRGVGHFPPRGEPRVLWAGFERSEPLLTLQRSVARHLEQAGCELERRKFHPHVTLARMRDAFPERVAAWLAERATFATEPFTVDRMTLFSSTLHRDGPIHREEATYVLLGRGEADAGRLAR